METTTIDVSENHQEEREVPKNFQKKLTIEIAGAAIFGALSIALSYFTTEYIPRVAWGLAYFDPVSLVWIISFLVFGFRAGMLTSIIGTLGLMPFDPFAPIGPLMKFGSTVWFILIPYLYSRLLLKSEPSGNDIKKLNIYIPSAIIAWLIRCILMSIFNYLILTYMFYMTADLGWLGFSNITGVGAILITIFMLNTIQSLFDVIVPYLLVFSTKIYDRFQIY
jgi:riboflavin transporter FmnP